MNQLSNTSKLKMIYIQLQEQKVYILLFSIQNIKPEVMIKDHEAIIPIKKEL